MGVWYFVRREPECLKKALDTKSIRVRTHIPEDVVCLVCVCGPANNVYVSFSNNKGIPYVYSLLGCFLD